MKEDEPILYIKASESSEVNIRQVYLQDIAEIECAQDSIMCDLKELKVLDFDENGPYKVVISILKIIQLINEKYPNMTIECLGAEDLIVKYVLESKQNKLLDCIRVCVVSAIVLIGSAYSIIAFTKDVDTNEILGEIYFQATGEQLNGYTIMEVSYSIGLVLGILVFFNYYKTKKKDADPNPMLVDMRKYEEDVDATLIQGYSRKDKEIDNDGEGSGSNHRSE